jgi:hypothetical protein
LVGTGGRSTNRISLRGKVIAKAVPHAPHHLIVPFRLDFHDDPPAAARVVWVLPIGAFVLKQQDRPTIVGCLCPDRTNK